MLKVIDIDYLGDYKLHLIFNDQTSGWVDLQDILHYPAYQSLKEKSNFIQYALVNGTIEWYNGADLAPEFLLSILHKEESQAA